MKKQLYALIFIAGSCLAAIESAQAQCPCANGSTPDSIVHTFTLAPTSDFSSTITFPRFNPATGTLNCVSILSTITAVANLGIRNRDSMMRDYEFLYTQAIGISGPGGLSGTATDMQGYGPVSLEAFGNPGDSAHFGPDTPFLNRQISRTITNVAPYMGTGNVSINFTNTGSTLLLQGSNNYQSTITTFAWGDFRLVYYYCENSVLPNGLKGFAVSKRNNQVLIEWTYENEPMGMVYDVELSRDGSNFKSIQKKSGQNNGNTGQVKYEHRYSLRGDDSRLYFRIRTMSADGSIAYSPVRNIITDGVPGSFTISPNPLKKHATIAFAEPQTGDYSVEIINMVGQHAYRNIHRLASQNLVSIEMPGTQAPGIYYLRVTNLSSKEQTLQKILIQ